MPLDNALLGVYPNGGMIHLCGSHEQLIPLFREMENLRSVQLNDRAAEDLKLYAIYLNPCNTMSAEEGLKIAGGRRMVIVE